MGWEALARWGDDVARIEPLAGGVANDVWAVRVNGHRAVGRLGARGDADLVARGDVVGDLGKTCVGDCGLSAAATSLVGFDHSAESVQQTGCVRSARVTRTSM